MKVLIAGGGTGGHVNPGLAIANYIKKRHPDASIIFVGTRKGLESKLVPREGYELKYITVRGFARKLSKDTLEAVRDLFRGLREARKILKEFRPDIVIGTGGYVCGPVLYAAARLKIPCVIHEQNAYPGVTNRILSRFVDAVAISFKEAEPYFKSAKKLVFTGNPVKQEMLAADRNTARQRLGIPADLPFAVVVCGSRGAAYVNKAVTEMLTQEYKPSDFRLLFGTGDVHYEAVREQLKGYNYSSVEVVPYIFNAADVYAAADLLVCRAGALTIAELTAIGVPSVMIPSPYVTANHQEHNARSLEKQGGTVVILEKELSGKLLYQQITRLLKDREQLTRMSKSAKKAGILNATEKIYGMVMEAIKKV